MVEQAKSVFGNSTRKQSHEITSKIPANFGEGIEWAHDDSRYVTVLTEKPRTVYGEVGTFRGMSFGAVHYYGYLKFSNLSSRYLQVGKWEQERGTVNGDTTNITCGDLPKDAGYHTIEITHPALEDIFRISLFDTEGDKKPDYKKGEHTDLFDSKKEVIEAIRSEFKRIFGDGWVLEEGFDEEEEKLSFE